MNKLREKLNKEKGFTLVEMLIVVAIIAILIAIAIPMVNKALERAREATDAANERAAVGLAMIEVLTEDKLPGADNTAYYAIGKSGTSNASSGGSLVGTEPDDSMFNYGKGTKVGDSNAENAGKGIKITYDPTVTGNDVNKMYKIEWK